jgi:copper chaperone CopZ
MSENVVLSVPGMKCGGCVNNVEKALNGLAGVSKADVDLDSKTATVEADVPVSELVAAIRAAGYEAEPVE